MRTMSRIRVAIRSIEQDEVIGTAPDGTLNNPVYGFRPRILSTYFRFIDWSQTFQPRPMYARP